MSFRRALIWSLCWIAAAIAFGIGLSVVRGGGTEFFTAYVLEKALSVDNLLVITMIFTRFGIPPEGQRKALNWGVAGALVMRAALILGGIALVSSFHAFTYVLGGILLLAAISMLRGHDESGKENWIVRLTRRWFRVSDDRTRLFAGGTITTLFLAILAVEATDLMFALDSIPAVLGITTDPLIAITSNLFAVLGLRSLYFVIVGMLTRLRHLDKGLALVLAFVGLKLIAFDIPVAVSLAVIAVILGGAAVASLIDPHAKGTDHDRP